MGKWYTKDKQPDGKVSFIDNPAISLQQPCRQMRALVDDADQNRLPWHSWSYLIAIAFAGSGIYGASLKLALPQWQILQGALWITLSAGAGWAIFIPTLMLITRVRATALFHACLVTMAYGEAVLVTGALLNLVLALTHQYPFNAGWFNFAIVAFSNLIMATVLALQLRQAVISIKRTLTLWMLVLNGSGAIFFLIFRAWLRGGQ